MPYFGIVALLKFHSNKHEAREMSQKTFANGNLDANRLANIYHGHKPTYVRTLKMCSE